MEPKEEKFCANCAYFGGRLNVARGLNFGPCDKLEITAVMCGASCPSWKPMSILHNDRENDENAAWEFAQRIGRKETEGGMSIRDLNDCFGYKSSCEIFGLSYKEARDKYNAWIKKRRKVIRIGDEVESEELGIKMVVTKMYPNPDDKYGPILNGICSDGSVRACRFSDVIKTGNHWDCLDDYCIEMMK